MESFRSLTVTQRDQILVEQQVFDIFKTFYNLPRSSQPFMLELQREKHVEYLTKGLTGLGPSFCVLDANRPWICYWILHSIALLDEFVDPELEDNTIDFLSRCQLSMSVVGNLLIVNASHKLIRSFPGSWLHINLVLPVGADGAQAHCALANYGPNGGYAGGPGQASKILDMIIVKLLPTIFCMLTMPHLATTYAAVNSLVTLGGDKALSSINRWSGYAIIEFEVFIGSYLTEVCNFLQRKTIHVFAANERCQWGIQSSLSVVLNCGKLECFSGLSDALCCQTYEGGISGEPGSEAHGGYTFCGLATMILINEVDRLDLSSLTDWVVFRQGVEGGFQGRTNKLVDGCYSFWQGGIFALLKRLNSTKGVKPIPLGDGEGSGEESLQTTASSDAAGEEGLNEDLSLGGSHSEI
ncbi:hypothetical protein Golob_014507, partial [Gossypium lobatum]|nr:hypothetical protein [Gossypium lobatum]